MNRYFWSAIILAIISVFSLVSIWIVDFTNPNFEKRITLTIYLVTAIGTVSVPILAYLGLKTKKQTETSTTAPLLVRQRSEISGELLDRDESVSQYLSNLEALLDEYGPIRSRFVDLTAEIGAGPEIADIKLLQSFEWANRNWQDDVSVTKESIDLLSAHEKFKRYVLLGDPGAGKTTCLQYLVLDLISKYRSGASTLLPIYISLSDWRDRRASALEFLHTSLAKIAGPNSSLVREFENMLSQGDFLIILDGLNEMPDRYFHQEREQEQDFLNRAKILTAISTGEIFRSRQDPRERSLRELATSAAIRTHFIVSCP